MDIRCFLYRKMGRRNLQATLALRTVCGLIVAALLFGLIVWRALSLDLVADRSSSRVLLFALPVCITDLYHSGNKNYTMWSRLHNLTTHHHYTIEKRPYFADASQLIRDLLASTRPKAESKVSFWGYDDRGLSDYCKLAFLIFGPSLSSFSKLWLTILALSAVGFLLSFGRHKVGPPLLWVILYSVYLGLGLYSFQQTATSLHEERAFEYLTLLSALHIALMPHLVRVLDWRAITGLVIQVGIFVFIYHARSSIGWQLLPIAASAAFALYRYRTNVADIFKGGTIKQRFQRSYPVAPLLVLIAGLIVLTIHTRTAYHSAYFAEQGGRNFYHNALMGLHGMRFDGEPRLSIDDGLVKTAVRKHIARIKNKNFNEYDYTILYGKKYEEDAKKYYCHLISRSPTDTISYYFGKIPRTFNFLIGFTSIRPTAGGPVRIGDEIRNLRDPAVAATAHELGLFLSLVTPVSFLIVLSGSLIYGAKSAHWLLLSIIVALFFAASFIPSVAFYNQGTRQIMGMALSATLICHIALLVFTSSLIIFLKFLSQFSPHRRSQ